MKNILITFILSLFISCLFAQTWQWSSSAGGVINDEAIRTCTDQSGNIYIIGSMNGYVTGNGIVFFNSDTLSINGYNDLFIAKYDVNGNEVWVKSFGGNNNNMTSITSEGISDIYFDSLSNSIYVSGAFYGSCTFDSITLNSCGGTEMFFARYDLNGNCLWAKKSCGIGEDSGGPITGDNSGNLFILISMNSGGTLDTTTLSNGLFLAEYDVNGNLLWVKKISDIHFTGFPLYSPTTFIYKDNNLYIYGFAYVDDLTIDTMTFEATNYYGVILSKWDLVGNVLWGKRFGGPVFSVGSMDIDGHGNFYMTGTYDLTAGNYAIFDNDTVYAISAYGGFLTKYNSSGNKVWVKEINSSQHLNYLSCITDEDGNTHIASSFKDTLFLDSDTITAINNLDAFIAGFDSSGNLIGAVTFGDAHIYDIMENNNSLYVTGTFSGSVNLGNTINSHGGYDMFIAKHDAITRVEELRSANNQLYIYANPNKGTCTITVPDEFYNEKNLLLQIYDTSGKLLQQSKIEIQQDKIKVNIQEAASGVYPVILTNGKKSYSGKIVFE